VTTLQPPSVDDPATAWVLSQPGPKKQLQKSAQERGTKPSMSPDTGLRGYHEWDRAPSTGQMIVPKDLRLGPNGEFDVFFHFHGHEPARKAWVQAMTSAVLVGVDLGMGSGNYQTKFQNREEFRYLLGSVEAGVARHLGVTSAQAGRIGLSSWSAGYGAVGQILRDSKLRERIDTVVLLDGLHAGIDGSTIEAVKLEPFLGFAREASLGDKFMFVSHSSIIPPNYASTTQTANYLIWRLGGEPETTTSRPGDPVGLDLIRRFSNGEFHVRGFAGNDTLDHCAHLSLYEDVLRTHVAPRWRK
jgi:hypothetical protein